MSETRTFYVSRWGRRYHRDRQCWYLRDARSRDAVLTIAEPDPGLGETLITGGGRQYRHCTRCGV